MNRRMAHSPAMPRYSRGQEVRALYLDPRHGTVLGSGTVTRVTPRPDGGQAVTVKVGEGIHLQQYLTYGPDGHSDYLKPA